MSEIKTQDIESPWSNGVTLKKTRDGYSWTISVAAENNSLEAMKAAIAKTAELDIEFRLLYPDGEERAPKRR